MQAKPPGNAGPPRSSGELPRIAAERLGQLRAEIDGIDEAIVMLIAERLGIVREVATIKSAHDLPVVVPERYDDVLRRVSATALTLGIDPGFIRRLYEAIHAEACRIEDTLTSGPALPPFPNGRH